MLIKFCNLAEVKFKHKFEYGFLCLRKNKTACFTHTAIVVQILTSVIIISGIANTCQNTYTVNTKNMLITNGLF